MIDVAYVISKEDYEKALKEGADSLISDAIKWGYGVYLAKVVEIDGQYWLRYSRGETCD